MNITQNLLTPNSYSRPRTGLNKVKAVVIHWVANPGSSAEGNRNFFESRKSGTNGYGSAHYIVKENTVIQCIPNNEMAYHVGSNVYTQSALRNLSSYPNNCTIGIEMCHNDMTGKPTDATYKTTLELACSLLKKYDLTHENLWTHHQVVGWKDCHRYYTNNPSEWVRFVQDASKILTGKSVTIPTPTPANNKDLEAPDVKTRESYIKNTVIADSLNVRTQRNSNSSIVLTLPKGSTVQYQKGSTQNGWGYIKYTNSKGATYSGYVNVKYIKSDAELGKSTPKPKPTSKPDNSGIKSVGKIKVVGVKSAAIVMDRPDKNKAKNLGTVDMGDTIDISGSVKGANNAKGYWEVIYKGKRGYISGQFGSKI